MELKTLYIQNRLLLFYLEEMKNYYSLSVSRAVSQVIMRVRKLTVAYKLALQQKTQGSIMTYYYKNKKKNN